MDVLTAQTAVELDVLKQQLSDVWHQLALITNAAHSRSFTQDELANLKLLTHVMEELDLGIRTFVTDWKARTYCGKKPNRSDTRGADAAGTNRPGDDVPTGTPR